MTNRASPILQAVEEALAGLRQAGVGPTDAAAELEEKLLEGLRSPETVLRQDDWYAIRSEACARMDAKPK
jgi:hypothetical protein